MSERAPVLVLGNDLNPASTKTTRDIRLALTRLGYRAVERDTRLTRWSAAEVEKESAARREAYETGVAAKWKKFVFDYGIGMIISVDLDWFFASLPFVTDSKVKQIHSFWLGEIDPQLQSKDRFPLDRPALIDLLKNPKISHHCCGGQAEGLRALGIERVFSSVAAADAAESDLWERRLKEALA